MQLKQLIDLSIERHLWADRRRRRELFVTVLFTAVAAIMVAAAIVYLNSQSGS